MSTCCGCNYRNNIENDLEIFEPVTILICIYIYIYIYISDCCLLETKIIEWLNNWKTD